MKTDQAIEQAGSTKALADLLGITPSAISQWGKDVPDSRCWQLKVLKPEWFEATGADCRNRRAETAPCQKARG